MTFVHAFIAVGSNIAPLIHIPRALERLKQQERIIASSTFYQTNPIGRPDQPPFVNGVWCIKTLTTPESLKQDCLASIEDSLGRIRTDDKFAPRTIDLDLILYDNFQYRRQELKLPHPDLSRTFVLGPTLELLEQLKRIDLLTELQSAYPPITTIGQPLTSLTEQLQTFLELP